MFFKSFGKSSNLLGVGFGVFGVGSGVFGVDPFFICKVMFGRGGVSGGVAIFYTTQCLYSIFFVSTENSGYGELVHQSASANGEA